MGNKQSCASFGLIFFCAILVLSLYGCAVFNKPSHGEQRITSHIEDLIEQFQHAGKDRSELIKIGRALITKVGRPQVKEHQSWQVEVQRSEMVDLLNYMAGVWGIRKVMVGGDGNSRYVEIHVADKPVGVWVYEGNVVTDVNAHDIGYESAQSWGSAIVIVCDERRYGIGTGGGIGGAVESDLETRK